MNLEQVDALCSNTCGTIENMECAFEAMKSNGLSKKDIEKVNDAINVIYALNQKFVKKRKELGYKDE